MKGRPGLGLWKLEVEIVVIVLDRLFASILSRRHRCKCKR